MVRVKALYIILPPLFVLTNNFFDHFTRDIRSCYVGEYSVDTVGEEIFIEIFHIFIIEFALNYIYFLFLLRALRLELLLYEFSDSCEGLRRLGFDTNRFRIISFGRVIVLQNS